MGTQPTIIPAAIGMMPAPAKKNSQVSSVKRFFSKVVVRSREKIVAKNPKMTHKDSALLMPRPL